MNVRKPMKIKEKKPVAMPGSTRKSAGGSGSPLPASRSTRAPIPRRKGGNT